MIYILIGGWTLLSLIFFIATKSFMIFVYMMIYGFMIMVVGVAFKLLRNMAARSLENFVVIEGVIVAKDKKTLLKSILRPSIKTFGNVRDKLDTQYNYIVVKTLDGDEYKVFVSEKPYSRVFSKIEAVEDIYEIGDVVSLSVTDYDKEFYMLEEFWVKFYQ